MKNIFSITLVACVSLLGFSATAQNTVIPCPANGITTNPAANPPTNLQCPDWANTFDWTDTSWNWNWSTFQSPHAPIQAPNPMVVATSTYMSLS